MMELQALETDAREPAETTATAPAETLYGMTSEDKVRLMAEIADAVRAEEIVVLDLRDLTIIADFFLICTGKSSIQLRAVADRIEERLREMGLRKLRVEGYQEATWILLDYGDVIAHVMAAEQRAYYDIESFWAEAKHLELDLKPETATGNAPRTVFQSMTPVGETFSQEPLAEAALTSEVAEDTL